MTGKAFITKRGTEMERCSFVDLYSAVTEPIWICMVVSDFKCPFYVNTLKTEKL